mgnify:FL=1
MLYLVTILTIILDGYITYIYPFYFNNITYLYPMLTLSLIVSISSNKDAYLKYSLIIGFIYDLLYSTIFLYNTLIFLMLAKINKKILNSIRESFIIRIILLILNIIIYDSISFLIVYLTKYNDVTFLSLFYKISHSLILNILSLFVISFILKKYRINHKL